MLRFRRASAPEPEAKAAHSFHREVFARELEYIQDRWRAVDSDHPKKCVEDKAAEAEAEAEGEPKEEIPAVSTENQLVGLAFSGGGIRSATFNLGVLQVLYRRGVFKFVDYLSTVSGGGFLGCSLSTLLSENARRGKRNGERLGEFPFAFSSTKDEPVAVSYLRNNSNYLAPRGLVDYLRVFAVLVRGILLNFAVLLPLLLICSMVVTVVFGQQLLDHLRDDDSRRELGVRLERNWAGMESDQRLDGLLKMLKAEAMIDTRRGMTENRVVQWLRGEASLEGDEWQHSRPPLVSGSGVYANYRILPEVSTEQLVHRLWESETLRDVEAMREVDAVERSVRATRGFEDRLSSVSKLFDVLHKLTAEGEFPLLRREAVGKRFTQTLADQGLVEKPEGCLPFIGQRVVFAECYFKNGVTLRQVLQQLYDRGLYDPAFLQWTVEQTVFAPPLAYWEFHEIATIEGEVLEELPGAREAEPRELLWTLLKLNALDLPRLARRIESLPLATHTGTASVLPIPDLGGIELATDLCGPSTGRLTLYCVVRQLYETGMLAEDRYVDPLSRKKYYDEPEEYEYYDPSREAEEEGLLPTWDPFKLRLPYTFSLMVAGIFWILVFPVTVSVLRFFRLRLRSRFAIGCGLLVFLLLVKFALLLVMVFPSLFGPFSEGVFLLTYLAPGLLEVVSFKTILIVAIAAVLLNWLIRKLQSLRSALWWRDLYERSFSLLLIAIAVVAFIELQPFLIFHYRHLQQGRIWWTLGIGAASLLASMLAGPALAVFKKAGRTLVILAIGVLGPILPLLVYMHLVIFVIYAPGKAFREWAWDGPYLLSEPFFLWSFGLLAVLVHFLNLPIDVNSTSLHGFYRDRLSQAYLLRTGEEGSVGPEDDLSLTEICQNGSGAPYHLINATLNLQGSRDPRLRRRRGDFFVFSRFFVGGGRTGYCPTQEMETVFPYLPVSSAMAVSAAAASPNMGTFTFGPMVILMALLNIRLGYWIPNPHRVNRWSPEGHSLFGRALRAVGRFAASLAGSFRARPGAYVLLKEMLSLMHDGSRLVNLTDGGHMENTGVFELLRRRCRYIIVGDAEADAELRFGGLAALIRFARIDLGIEIDIHVDDLKLDASGQSRQHCALGVIRYPARDPLPAETGFLLYIKSSFTGDEDEIVSEYRTRSPAFPHESTADQAFTEGQFEAYRDLGYHIADGLFEEFGRKTITTFRDFSEWFDVLSVDLMPGLSDKVALAETRIELGRIERMLREPEYSSYFYEIYPDLRPADAAPVAGSDDDLESFRHVFHLVNIQLQLMESLFVSLELDQIGNREHPANRGWMNLFSRWAQARSFRRAYLPSIANYSAPFQQFCRVALGLRMHIWWKSLSAPARKAVAEHAAEIGLQLLERPARRGQTSLLLRVEMEGIDPIPIGAAIIERAEGTARVDDLQLRPGYQGAGIRAQGLLELRRWAESKKMIFEIDERTLR